jgi:hypothetical protein
MNFFNHKFHLRGSLQLLWRHLLQTLLFYDLFVKLPSRTHLPHSPMLNKNFFPGTHDSVMFPFPLSSNLQLKVFYPALLVPLKPVCTLYALTVNLQKLTDAPGDPNLTLVLYLPMLHNPVTLFPSTKWKLLPQD